MKNKITWHIEQLGAKRFYVVNSEFHGVGNANANKVDNQCYLHDDGSVHRLVTRRNDNSGKSYGYFDSLTDANNAINLYNERWAEMHNEYVYLYFLDDGKKRVTFQKHAYRCKSIRHRVTPDGLVIDPEIEYILPDQAMYAVFEKTTGKYKGVCTTTQKPESVYVSFPLKMEIKNNDTE